MTAHTCPRCGSLLWDRANRDGGPHSAEACDQKVAEVESLGAENDQRRRLVTEGSLFEVEW